MVAFSDILIARQPILRRDQKIFGYELLFRATRKSTQANVIDEDDATTQVIINSFADLGLETIVGENKAFINLTKNFIIGKNPLPFPPDKVVLEILENITIDAALIGAVKAMKERGYMLALDDVADIKSVLPLLPYVQFVKIDMMRLERGNLPSILSVTKKYHVNTIAEKIETQEDFHYCANLGCDLFQGFFFCKPNIVEGKRLESSRLILLRSLASLQDPKVDYAYLEHIIAQDTSLGYKLLRLVNSAQYGLSVEVKSLRQAISLIGTTYLRGWMSLLLMASLDNKPHELTHLALTRARMAELLSKHLSEGQPEQYFMVGLFSVLDALMDMPMVRVLEYLPLNENVCQALLNHQGRLGRIIQAIIAYEQGEIDQILNLKIQPEIINKIYLETLLWTDVLQKGIYL